MNYFIIMYNNLVLSAESIKTTLQLSGKGLILKYQ